MCLNYETILSFINAPQYNSQTNNIYSVNLKTTHLDNIYNLNILITVTQSSILYSNPGNYIEYTNGKYNKITYNNTVKQTEEIGNSIPNYTVFDSASNPSMKLIHGEEVKGILKMSYQDFKNLTNQ